MTDDRGKHLSPTERRGVYAARHYVDRPIERKLGTLIDFDVYLQDPYVAATTPAIGWDKEFEVEWEPLLGDGPTSARFAVVDYNGDTGVLVPPAQWNPKTDTYEDDNGTTLNREQQHSLQFHQVNVWAVLQRALEFYESTWGLGRRIPWGFDGNRLIVVPHAGYGQNAFYDRESKSLQFYYFEGEQGRVYTCLSTDIINHEFGHAVLDGIRPHFIEGYAPEAAAFHEFIGDLTAILLLLRNNQFRRWLADQTAGDLSHADHLFRIAEQFGTEVTGKPYLRTACNHVTMSDLQDTHSPHYRSQVLTGALFEIIIALADRYIAKRNKTAPQALWHTIQRMHRLALQALDLLPPVDVTFKDYALAVLRMDQLAHPLDPHDYRTLMLDVFNARGILDNADIDELRRNEYLYERVPMHVFHDINSIARSRADAYRFLDDNRPSLGIPLHQDVVVADLYTAEKCDRTASPLPRQVVLEYLWREDVLLESDAFGEYAGQYTTLPCGGTLVFDDRGRLLFWAHKPGSETPEGQQRRLDLFASIERAIETGLAGTPLQTPRGIIASTMPDLIPKTKNGRLQFELSPHLGLDDPDQELVGGRRCEISS
jgi:hypothetical protein